MGFNAREQRAHPLVGRGVEVVLKTRALGRQVFLLQQTQALQVGAQGGNFLQLVGQCPSVFSFGPSHLADDVLVQFSELIFLGAALLLRLRLRPAFLCL